VRLEYRSTLVSDSSAVRLFDMKLKLAVGATLVLACGGGGERGTSSPGEVSDRGTNSSVDGSDSSGGESELAGGETSEFSGGDISYCPEIVSNEPLDLARAEWAPWVVRVAGRHELTLGWLRLFEADTVTGFEEHTSIVLEVSVIGGRALEYGAGEYSGYELEGCNGQRAEQLGLAFEIATGDGALVASYQEWFQRYPDDEAPGGEVLSVGSLHPDRDGDGVAFTGNLVLDISPAFDGDPLLYPNYFSFDANGARGALMPALRASERREATPIEGIFPDDPCRGSGRSVPLDADVDFADLTPRQLFQRVASRWEAAPSAATWSTRDGSSAGLPATEVNLRAGEPTLACVSGSSIEVHAPLTLTTADGRVNLTRSVATSVAAQGGASTQGQSTWLPASRFETEMGISGVDFTGAEYGSVSLFNAVGYADGRGQGSLDVSLWRADGDESADGYPHLTWCQGVSCD
jgi:hypothetical protein